MSASPAPDLDLLLAHSAWVRALARRMVGAEAEDLVQETWLAALAHPRGEPRQHARWLAGVLARLARQTRRGEGRRRVREGQAARAAHGRAEPSVAETFEAAATGRELADLVLALEEPFRAVVLLRYYEDLPPRRIAERLGIPVRTVNSRLTRGVERLRERWRQRETSAGGDGRAGLSALLLLAEPRPWLTPAASAGAAVVPIGVALMNAKLVLGAVVLGGGALVWWLRTDSVQEPRAAVVQGAALADERVELEPAPEIEPARLAPGAAPAPIVARTAIATPPAEVTPTPPAATRTIRGRVLDPEARPLAGIEVGYRAHGSERELTTVSRAPNGAFELEVPRGGGDLRATDPSYVSVMSGRVDARTEVEPLLVIAPRIAFAGVVLDEPGSPLSGVRVSFQMPRGFKTRFEAVFDATECAEWRMLTGEDGRFALDSVAAIAGAELVAELEGFEPWRGAIGGDGAEREVLGWNGERELVIELARKHAAVPAVSGRVVDPDGRPVAGAWVSLGKRSTATDAAGEFRLERDDALKAFELRALKAGYRIARLAAVADADGAPAWPDYVVLVLGDAPLALAGRIVDGDVKPRAGMRVWLADPTPFGVLADDMTASAEFYLGAAADGDDPGDAYWFSRDTEADGRFRLDGLLERDYSLRVMNTRTLEIVTLGPFAAGEEALELVFTDGKLGRIDGRLVGRDGRPLAGVSVELLGNTWGGIWNGAGSTQSDAEGRFTFEGVGGETLKLAVRGDDIIPLWAKVEPPRGGESRVELVLSVRCHFKVDLATSGTRADSLRVLDGEGNPLVVFRIGPGGTLMTDDAPIVEGRSDSLGVDERARTLVLELADAEVLRLPLALRPGVLEVVTP